jgi:pimeloyl-ACP methyl ester carboxylesterase
MSEHRAEVAGTEVFWHESPPRTQAPVLYVHGVPTDSDNWLPFLERTGGLAPDLPGFGRSGKPADFDHSIEGYADFLEAFLDSAGVERFSLLVHDWGAVGLALAQRRADRVDRLVIANAVPLLPGYRWHRVARAWRRPVVGELLMGLTTRWAMRRELRRITSAPDEAAREFADRLWSNFDHGTQRAILKLYRSAPEDVLARAGERLGDVEAPALVVWGTHDPFIPTSFAHAYADALGGPARVELDDGAGHWFWVDRPELVDTIAGFLLGDRVEAG